MNVRCFIAVELDTAVKKQLDRFQERLRRQMNVGQQSIKWVRSENIHLTLKFLGDVDDKMTHEIAAAVTKAAAGFDPFDFEPGNCGCFPEHGSTRVLWVGINAGSEELEALAEAVDVQLDKIGFAREGRRFSPHLTLARIRQSAAGYEVRHAVDEIEPFTLAAQSATQLAVLQSDLSGPGPVYTVLHRVPLG